MIVSLGHRVVCIIVSNSSVDWLGDWRGWSQSPCSCNKIFCRPNSARKLPNWLLRWFVTSGFHFIIVWKRLFRGSGKPGNPREFHFAKFVSTLYWCSTATLAVSLTVSARWPLNDSEGHSGSPPKWNHLETGPRLTFGKISRKSMHNYLREGARRHQTERITDNRPDRISSAMLSII